MNLSRDYNLLIYTTKEVDIMARRKLNKKELIDAINEGRHMSDDKKYKEVELELLNRRR